MRKKGLRDGMKQLNAFVAEREKPYILWASNLEAALDRARDITETGFIFRGKTIPGEDVLWVYVEGSYTIYGKQAFEAHIASPGRPGKRLLEVCGKSGGSASGLGNLTRYS